MTGVSAMPIDDSEIQQGIPGTVRASASRPAPPTLELPADRPRARRMSERRLRAELPLSAGAGAGSPPPDLAALVAAVAALAARTTGRRDPVVGAPAPDGDRSRPLAVRLEIAGDPAFGDLVEAARAGLERARSEGPVTAAEGALDPAYHPVVQVAAAVRGEGDPEIDPAALRSMPDAPPLDLVFVLDGPVLAADFDAERFEHAGPVHLEALRAILAAGLADPETPVGSLPLASPPTIVTLLGDWAVVRREYPREAGIAALFAEQVAERPDTVAVVEPGNGRRGARTVSYAELDRRSGRLAGRLAALGIARGTPVVIALEHSLALVEAMVAVVRAGGVYVPIDAAYPADRLAFMLEDAAAPVVLTRSGLRDRLPVPEGTEVVLLDAPAGDGPVSAAPQIGDGDDLAYVTYTSGSTGRPKGVAVPQRGVVRLVKGTDYARFSPDETFLHLAAVTFDLTTLEVWGPLLTGGRLVVFTDERPTPDRVAEALARERVTFLWLTAGLFHQIAEVRPEGLAPVTQLLAGGDALAAGACRRVLAACPDTLLIDGYGPTENTTFSSCHPMVTPETVSDPVSIGRPIANSEAFVLGTAMEPLPPLVPGELLVAGDGLARGYHRRPALTAEKFVPHPYSDRPGDRMYRTGDLARWRTDGTLEFLGRSDHQVKLRGFRIELTEIESVLAGHPGVGEVVVVARELPVAGSATGATDRVLVAFFVPKEAPGVDPPTPRALREHAAATLPEHMLPAAYVALAALPLSPNGKVDRKALPAPGPDDRASADEHLAPETPAERALAEIWAGVLGVSRVGRSDDFFALGGHSLLAASIFTRVADAFGVRMPVGSIFHARTLGAFARAVEAEAAGGAGDRAPLPPIEPRPERYRERAPLAHAQRGLWMIDQLRPGSAIYNLPTLFRIEGSGDAAVLSPARLALALGEIVRRHEGLRISFHPGPDGTGEQRFLPAASGSWPLAVADLSGLPEAARDAALSRALDAEARRAFDLSSPRPPVRALLVRLAPGGHRLLFHTHHAVFDGWSAETFGRELRALYAGGEPPPALPVTYGDYAVWQRESFSREALADEIEHWTEHLRGLPPVLELPTDRPRPKALSDRGGEVRLRIDPAVRTALEELARGEGATLFMALLAGFAAVLGRWSGRSDVPIGSPVAGRLRPELEGLLGLFVNTLVLRCDLGGAPGFRELLGRAREETARALSHSTVHFDLLAGDLATDHDESHHPIVQVLFAGQDLDLLDGELAPGLEMSGETLGTGTAKLDLTLFADRRAGAIEMRFEYSADLFDRPTIERLAGHLANLLRAAVAAPDAPVASLPILGGAERALLLEDWRGRRTDYPRGAGLAELFARQVAERPDAVAVAAPSALSAPAAGVQLTYAGLDRRSRALAARIARAPGFVPGTAVGLAVERSADLAVAILAVVRAGGLYVPLDADYPEERLTFLTRDAGVRVLVSEETLLARLPFLLAGAGPAVVRIDPPAGGAEDSAEGREWSDAPAGGEAAAYVCYTSGSTGRPKGAVVPQRAVARLVLEADFADFGPDETFLLLAPVSFDAATLELWGPLLTGGRLAVHPPSRPTPEGLGAILARERVTALWLTAGLFHQVVEDAPEALAPLRRLLAGGDVLSPALCRSVLAAHPGLVLVDGYGPTENTTFTCCHVMSSAAAVEEPVPIGRPIADTTVAIVGPDLRLQPLGVPGELVTGGDGLAWGYWNRPGLTAERFVPDPFPPGGRLYRTGDLARWRPAGTIEFLGRNDGQVKIRGFRIELGEIESALTSHPGVHRAVVVARAAADGGERVLVGYVVPEADAAPEEGELRAWLEARLPLHMVPGALPVLRELPLDPNGKVDRRALPDPADLPGGRPARIAPRSATEHAVAAIWREVLGTDDVAVGDDFFRLGGHSLLAARVMSRVRASLGVEMSLGRLFELRTLEAFAREVESRRAASGPGSDGGPSGIRRAERRRIVRKAEVPASGGDET